MVLVLIGSVVLLVYLKYSWVSVLKVISSGKLIMYRCFMSWFLLLLCLL